MRKLTPAAQAAKLIRTKLKEVYPEIKFEVTSKNYSMGDSINIKYIDGPTSDTIENLVCKYQMGHFDGMTDCYEYSNSRNDIPQSKFVFVDRSMSDNIKTSLLKKVVEYWGESNSQKLWEKTKYDLNSLIRQEFVKMDLYNKPVKKTENIQSERDELEALRKWKRKRIIASWKIGQVTA